MAEYDYISIEGYLVKIVQVKEQHSFQPFKAKIPYNYCRKCGLIRLNNKISLKAASIGCVKYTDIIVGKI